uniref:Growth arrest and DNA damage-inducible protein GADD45 alpha n=2 Tax=Cetacea TaxID=9721 RepID=A0A8C0CHC8_BALMU
MTLEEFSAGEQKTERGVRGQKERAPHAGRAPRAFAKGRSDRPCRMDKVGDALEEVLSKALSQRTITVGVYEAAKLLNVDPDNVVLCLLAADEDDDRDVALQIHFTLIQAFCCENDIDILRVSNPGRLAELLLLESDAGPALSEGAEQPPDLHCVLVTNPHSSQWKDPALSQLICFCRESRYMDQWVPVINLPER